MVHSLNIFDYPALSQFNQPGISTCLSQTGCADTSTQGILQYYLERLVPLNQIRAAAGIPVDCIHGLTMQGVLNALNYFGVDWYAPALGTTASFILQKAYVGPVMTGVGYRLYPAKKGAACGQNNLAQIGGKVDCGFNGAHAILVLGSTPVKDSTGKVIRYDAFTRDPDHFNNIPAYDRITGTQLSHAMNALLTDTAWKSTYAIYPTKSKANSTW